MISKKEALDMSRDGKMEVKDTHVKTGPKTSQEYADEIQAKEDLIDELSTQLRIIRNKWVEDHCPIKIGDILVGNDYSYKGKQFKVERVFVSDRLMHGVAWDVRWKWVASGPVLLKNGTLGRNYSLYAVAVENVKWKK